MSSVELDAATHEPLFLRPMSFKFLRFAVAAVCALATGGFSAAHAAPPVAAATAVESRGLNDWLMRMHEASRNRSYTGTFVVSSGGVMSSAKIWHACDGDQQMERVETLTGAPRSIFRRDDQVITFFPDSKVARTETRESLGLFPALLKSTDSHIADFYRVKEEGRERVAGVEADVIAVLPKDNLRFGYRAWAEHKKGLLLKLQTLDEDGKVLEQAAFSELQMDAPVKMDRLAQMMGNLEGYRVEKSQLMKTSASAEGWVLKTPVAGFQSMSCYKRGETQSSSADPIQWVFSDGLASVSIFVEPFDSQRHNKEQRLAMGATRSMTRHIDAYWLTLMGEVPVATLNLFADAIERKKP